jgi:putative flippase GtrA
MRTHLEIADKETDESPSQSTFRSLVLPTILKMVSFAMVGVANALVDFGVFALAYKLLGTPLVPSNVVAWLVAVSGSYVMNTLITFRHESGRILSREDYLKFVASGILGVFSGDHDARRPFVFC